MRILFICSSLEPGRDGVGDYTRKLAAELVKQQFKIILIAFNDRFIREDFIECTQPDENETLEVIRFSSNTELTFRLNYIKKLATQYSFDWISLQYVPYGFNKKGIPFYLPKAFAKLRAKARWHIMFHETWIGMSAVSPFTHKVYGYFQKKIIAALIKKLKPNLLTTTNLVYQLALQEKNFNAERLPLFSNISVYEQDESYVSALEKKYAVNLKTGEYFRLGIFGTLYPEAQLSDLVPAFIKEKHTGKKIMIIVFGKNSRPEELNKLKQQLPGAVVCIELGELAPCHTSNVFKLLDEAVLCTPVEYIGKSGAYAALRLHGVKVVSLSYTPITRYEEDILQYNQYLSEREAAKWSAKYIKDKFIALLHKHT